MAIHYEKGGKIVALGGQDQKVKIQTAPQVRKLSDVPALRLIDLENLEKSRGKYVLQVRETGISCGAWYRNEDWDADGKLIAVGEAKAHAVDPWANDRAAGRDSVDGLTGNVIARPSIVDLMRILGLEVPKVTLTPRPALTPKPVNKTVNAPKKAPKSVNAPDSVNAAKERVKQVEKAKSARSDMAAYMRDSRAAKKLGMTVAEYRASQAAKPKE